MGEEEKGLDGSRFLLRVGGVRVVVVRGFKPSRAAFPQIPDLVYLPANRMAMMEADSPCGQSASSFSTSSAGHETLISFRPAGEIE